MTSARGQDKGLFDTEREASGKRGGEGGVVEFGDGKVSEARHA